MNYNIVAHTEDSSYFDSCGDFNRQDGKFYHEYFTAEETFIANWADIIVEDYETVTIILDGVTDESGGHFASVGRCRFGFSGRR